MEWGLMLVSTTVAQRPFLVVSSVVDDVVDVGRIVTIRPLSAVLSYSPTSITFSQAFVATD
jgi:hypothetical protein